MLFGLKLVEKYVIQNNTSCSVYKKWCAQPKKKSADCEKSNTRFHHSQARSCNGHSGESHLEGGSDNILLWGAISLKLLKVYTNQ